MGMPQKMQFPFLLVLKEKHEDAYFYVPDEATLYTLALEVVKKRQATGYFYTPVYDEPKKLDFSKEDLPKMPESVRKDSAAKLKKHEAASRAYQQDQKDLRFIKQTITDQNGEQAWQILKQIRCDHEYEQALVRQLTKPGGYRA
jgi:hypothetical protein